MTDADGGVFMDDTLSRSLSHSHIGLGVSYTPPWTFRSPQLLHVAGVVAN